MVQVQKLFQLLWCVPLSGSVVVVAARMFHGGVPDRKHNERSQEKKGRGIYYYVAIKANWLEKMESNGSKKRS